MKRIDNSNNLVTSKRIAEYKFAVRVERSEARRLLVDFVPLNPRYNASSNKRFPHPWRAWRSWREHHKMRGENNMLNETLSPTLIHEYHTVGDASRTRTLTDFAWELKKWERSINGKDPF